jgi:hypothetical protein
MSNICRIFIMDIQTFINGLVYHLLEDYNNHCLGIYVRSEPPIFEFDEDLGIFYIKYDTISKIPLLKGGFNEKKDFKRILWKTIDSAYKTLGKTLNRIKIGKQTKTGFDEKIFIN